MKIAAWVRARLPRVFLMLGLLAPGRLCLAETLYSVTKTADTADGICDEDCSLREAIIAASQYGEPCTVQVPAGTYNLNPSGLVGTGELQVGQFGNLDITIAGAGKTTTTINQSRTGLRVFNLDPQSLGGVRVVIKDLTITSGSPTTIGGGGILVGAAPGFVNIQRCKFSVNHPSGALPGGAIFCRSGGFCQIWNCTFSDNFSDYAGGAIAFDAAPGTAELDVSECWFGGNLAGHPGGGRGGAIALFGQNTTFITACNSADNWAEFGSALYAEGGPVSVNYCRLQDRIYAAAGTTVDARENWWGCNGMPGGGCGSANSGPGSIAADPWLVFTALADPVSVCRGGATTLNAGFLKDSAGADTPYYYMWPFIGRSVSFTTVTHGTLTAIQAQIQENGIATATFTHDGSISAGTTTVTTEGATSTATIPINTLPTFTSTLQSSTVCPGDGAGFFAAVTGSGPFSFVWKKDGIEVTPWPAKITTTSTTSQLTISSAQAADQGTYSVEVTGPCNIITSSASLSLYTLPTVPLVQSSQSICAGSTAVLSGTAPPNVNIEWYAGGCGATLLGMNVVQVSPSTTTIYYALARDSISGCASASCASEYIFVTPSPSAASVGLAQSIPYGGTTGSLGANAPSNGTGVWSIVSGGAGTFTPSATTPSAKFKHTAGQGPVTLRWTISNPPCASSSEDVRVTIGPAIVAWRSVRSHARSGAQSIPLDAAATGNGLMGPTVESRVGGIQWIEVDFSSAVMLSNPSLISVVGRTTANGILGEPVSYPVANATMNDTGMLTITFQVAPNAGALPDQACYTITIPPAAVSPSLAGDTDVNIRALVGDATGSGDVNLSDVLLNKLKIAQPLAANARYDMDLSGSITNPDVLFAKDRVYSLSRKALCP